MKNIDVLFPLKLEQTRDTNIFLRKILDKAQQLRRNDPSFITKLLLKKNNIDKDQYFLNLMNIFGILLIVDKNKEIYSSNENCSYTY